MPKKTHVKGHYRTLQDGRRIYVKGHLREVEGIKKNNIIFETPKYQERIIDTPQVRACGRTFESQYKLIVSELPEEEYEKMAFIVDDIEQINNFIGTGNVKYYGIRSKKAFGTRSSGGMPNILSNTIPDNVYSELVKMTGDKNKYYKVEIASKTPESYYSSSPDNMFIKGDSLKHIMFIK